MVENRNINIPFSTDLFEGDMLVGSKIKKIALAGGDVSMAAAGSKRGATKLDIWPNGVIPFRIQPSINDGQFGFIAFIYTWSEFHRK